MHFIKDNPVFDDINFTRRSERIKDFRKLIISENYKHMSSTMFSAITSKFIPSYFKSCRFMSTQSQELDRLYSHLHLECRAHDKAVLESYDKFVVQAAKHLDIPYTGSEQPHRLIRRRTLLASRHVHKKYRVQYEVRTYFNIIKFKNITGSTADTFLEYVERNVPEGMQMTVTRHELGTLPFDI